MSTYRAPAPKPEGFNPPAVLPAKTPVRGCCDECRKGSAYHLCLRGTHGAWLAETTARLEAALERQAAQAVTMRRTARVVAWVVVAWAAGGLLGEVLR